MSNSNTQTFIIVLTILGVSLAMYAALSELHDRSRDEFRSEIKVLGAQIDGLDTQIDGLDTQIDGLDTRITEVRGDMNARFGEVKSDFNARFGEVKSDFNTQFTGLSNRVDSLLFLILEGRENISGLEARVKKLEAGVDEPETKGESLTESESQDTNASPPDVKNDELSDAADTNAVEPDGSESVTPPRWKASVNPFRQDVSGFGARATPEKSDVLPY